MSLKRIILEGDMNIKRTLTYLVIILLIGFLGVQIQAQDTYTGINDFKSSAFHVDYAQFNSDQPGLVKLEIYYKIFNRELQFVKAGSGWQAEYELTVTIYDKDGRQIDAYSKDKKVTVHSYASTVSINDFRISQLDQFLKPGEYKIEIHVIDKNSGVDSKQVIKPKLREYDSRYAQLSGIEFVQVIDTAMIDSVFRKGNLSIIPSVSRKYTGDSTARMRYYFEIYRGSNNREKVFIESKILGSKLETVHIDTVISEFGENETILRQVREISLNDMASGDYYVDVNIIGRKGRSVDEVREPFYLYWRPRAMVLHDFDKAMAQLKYVAQGNEVKHIKEAKTPEERLKRWDEFWEAHDPSPGTPENELKKDYYSRIEFANLNFSVLRREGWRTDRGMIFIQYGYPDQIEDYPFELESKAYQIWYYYRAVSNYHEPSSEPRKFIFVDDWGDGDFRLQYPYDGRRW